jgi:hemolysin activation/secretion protein
MTIDSTTFTPPPSPPVVIARKLQGDAGLAVRASSRGWDYVLTGNTLLPAKRLQAILAQAADPQQAVAEISAAYRDEGYFLVAVTAQLPEQSIPASDEPTASAARLVRISVIEGRVTQTELPAPVKPYFSGLSGKPDLTVDQVTRRAVMANNYAARNGEKLQTGFSPAEQPGGSVLTVNASPIPDFKRISGTLLLGNYGSRYASSYLAGGNVILHPGGGVELTANYVAGLPNWSRDSRGSQYHANGLGGSIVTPWGTYGLNAQKTHYQLGRISYPLNTAGDTDNISLNASQLLYASERSQLSLTQAFTHVDNRSTVFNGAYTLTDQRYDYASLGLSYTRGYSLGSLGGALVASYSYNRGTSARSGSFLLSEASTAPTPLFHYSSLNLSLQQQLPGGYIGQATLNGQWAQDTLPQQQQWVLGGLGNLSAYNSGVLVGDSGYAMRLSLQAPAHQWGVFTATPNAFIEHGAARYKFVSGGWQRITDIGVGLNLSTRFGTTLSALYAAPVKLENVPAQTAKASRATVFFVLQQNF